jgi:hypothetical protein
MAYLPAYLLDVAMNGKGIKVVQELLRHATIKMTLQVYAQAVALAKHQAQSRVVSMLKEDVGTKRGPFLIGPFGIFESSTENP